MENPSQQISESTRLPALKHPPHQTRLKTEPPSIKDAHRYCHQQTNLIGESNLINRNRSLLECKHTLAMSRIFNNGKKYPLVQNEATLEQSQDISVRIPMQLPMLSRYEKVKTQGSEKYYHHSKYHHSDRNIQSSFQITQDHSPLKEIQSSKLKINPELVLGVEKLTNLGLKLNSTLKTVTYAGHIKIPTVHNDYHSSKTNAGYSRSKIGGIYPK